MTSGSTLTAKASRRLVPLEVERLRGSDAADLLAWRRIAMTGEPDGFRFSALDDAVLGAGWWCRRLETDTVLLARRNGHPAAMGGWGRLNGSMLCHKGLVWGIYAWPEHRGAGAADAVMSALIDDARRAVRQLQLTVLSDNARAIALYERHGFRTYGREPDAVRRNGVYRDEVLMWRPLANHAAEDAGKPEGA